MWIAATVAHYLARRRGLVVVAGRVARVAGGFVRDAPGESPRFREVDAGAGRRLDRASGVRAVRRVRPSRRGSSCPMSSRERKVVANARGPCQKPERFGQVGILQPLDPQRRGALRHLTACTAPAKWPYSFKTRSILISACMKRPPRPDPRRPACDPAGAESPAREDCAPRDMGPRPAGHTTGGLVRHRIPSWSSPG